MKSSRPAHLLAAFLLVSVAVACDKSGGAAAPGAVAAGGQKDGPEGLKALFTEVHAAHAAGDFKKGKELTMALLPDKDALKKALKDDVPAETVDAILAPYKDAPPSDEIAAKALVPGNGRTEIRVHGSTTEDLVAYKEGTPAFAEFPGGAKKLAEAILRPGVTFYEVEVTEPGQDSGTKYHMFFHDGARWRMLGPAWRAVK